MFRKLEIRYRTQQLYRQQKFNLVREESEGYSKLQTELFAFSSSSSISDLSNAHTQSLIVRVRSLIGYFDLDPNRSPLVHATFTPLHHYTPKSYTQKILTLLISYLCTSTHTPSLHPNPHPIPTSHSTLNRVIDFILEAMEQSIANADAQTHYIRYIQYTWIEFMRFIVHFGLLVFDALPKI